MIGEFCLRIRSAGGEYRCATRPGEPLLLSGLRSGISLPYECATGTCGSCKATVVDGTVRSLWPEAPAAQKLRTGHVLACQTTCCSDVLLEYAKPIVPLRREEFTPDFVPAVISEVEITAPQVALMNLRLERPMSYHGGQFVLVGIPAVCGRRAYSIASYEPGGNSLRLIVKHKPGGKATDWLFAGNRRGTRIELFGPLGAAYLRPGVDKDILLAVGGSGVATALSILTQAERCGHLRDHRASVCFGVRTPGDLFLTDELKGFVRRHPDRVDVLVAFSNAAADDRIAAAHPEITFAEGLVHEALADRPPADVARRTAFLAGPPPMVEGVLRHLLTGLKLLPDRIRYDKFS